MADKMECPACKAYLSGIKMAFQNGEPCPECGLSAEAAEEVLSIWDTRANEALQAKAGAQRIELDRATAELGACKTLLRKIGRLVDEHQDVIHG
jgi:hypothetical protein